MKLNEKGYLKIGNSIVGWLENGVAKVTFDPDEIEFDQADFKDCVVLTVEEAEYALKVVRFAITTCEAVNEHKDKLWNFASLLHRRIDQVEGK